MPEALSPEDKLRAMGQAIRTLREKPTASRPRLSQEEAAEALGTTRQAWQQYEAGSRQLILRSDKQEEIAEALGVTHEQLLDEYERIVGGDNRPSRGARHLQRTASADQVGVPVRDTVQAGAWIEVDQISQIEQSVYPAWRDPRYPQADQWLDPVIGDSVDALGIFSGDYAHCVSTIAIGYSPRTGDIVEVERLRFDGSERELTLKQVEVQPGRLLLWPRSSNPRWREPIEILEGVTEETVEVHIRGLVIGTIRRF